MAAVGAGGSSSEPPARQQTESATWPLISKSLYATHKALYMCRVLLVLSPNAAFCRECPSQRSFRRRARLEQESRQDRGEGTPTATCVCRGRPGCRASRCGDGGMGRAMRPASAQRGLNLVRDHPEPIIECLHHLSNN